MCLREAVTLTGQEPSCSTAVRQDRGNGHSAAVPVLRCTRRHVTCTLPGCPLGHTQGFTFLPSEFCYISVWEPPTFHNSCFGNVHFTMAWKTVGLYNPINQDSQLSIPPSLQTPPSPTVLLFQPSIHPSRLPRGVYWPRNQNYAAI